MNPILLTEETTQEEESRLSTFYQSMLEEQMRQRAIEEVREAAPVGTRSDDDHPKDDGPPHEGPATRLLLTGRHDSEKATYTKSDLLKSGTGGELTEEDKELLQRLQQRDREVRQHEMTHVAALGSYAGSVRYSYQIGPDGRAYAIGGETEVLSAGTMTPEQKQQRARIVQTAAMAAGDPSRADMAVAANFSQAEQNAVIDMTLQRDALPADR